jgi:hypothetical protein
MSSYDTTAGGLRNAGLTGDPDAIRADLEQTRTELGDDVTALTDKVDPRSRMRRSASALRSRASSAGAGMRTAAPQKARQVGQAVRGRPAPITAIVLLIAGAGTATVLVRRRAAAARAARNRWRPGFLKR